MRVEEVNNYDFDELMSKVKREETLVAIPSFFALTMASEVLKSLAPTIYSSSLSEEYQRAVKVKFETAQFVGTACCVFPHYHNMPEIDRIVEWYDPRRSDPSEIAKARIRSFREIFDLEVNSLRTRNLFFILDDISSWLIQGLYIRIIKDIAKESKYQNQLDSIIISVRK